jgi:hypothetical protein
MSGAEQRSAMGPNGPTQQVNPLSYSNRCSFQEEVAVAFVQDFKVIDLPYDQVASCFVSGVENLFEAGLGPARAESERLGSKVAPVKWPTVLGPTLELRQGPLRNAGNVLLAAFSWETGEMSLIPCFDADVELAPFGSQQTSITLRGRYDPPLDAFGLRGQEALVQRLAESTLRAFLDGFCSILVDSRYEHEACASTDGGALRSGRGNSAIRHTHRLT